MKKNIYLCLFAILSIAACTKEDSNPSTEIKEVANTDYSLFPIYDDGAYGYVNSKGEVIVPFQFQSADYFTKDGLACVRKDGDYGFIDKKGNQVIAPIYAYSSCFSEGMACVRQSSSDNYNYINKDGETVIYNNYVSAHNFSDGLAAVKAKYASFYQQNYNSNTQKYEVEFDYWFYINTKGESKIEGKYSAMNDFYKGYAVVQKISDISYSSSNRVSNYEALWGVINKKGEEIVPNRYQNVLPYVTNDLLGFQDEYSGDWGFVNMDDELVISPVYDYVEPFLEGMAAVRDGSDWFFIDKEGLRVTMDYSFENVSFGFSEGLAAVEFNGKWGYINKEGEFKIKPQYSYAYPFVGGIAVVSNGYINKEGAMVWTCASPYTYKSSKILTDQEHDKILSNILRY